jgi:hypothetical protein
MVSPGCPGVDRGCRSGQWFHRLPRRGARWGRNADKFPELGKAFLRLSTGKQFLPDWIQHLHRIHPDQALQFHGHRVVFGAVPPQEHDTRGRLLLYTLTLVSPPPVLRLPDLRPRRCAPESGFRIGFRDEQTAMAEQTERVTRKVALKIIKLGMDTKQVVARFEAERQALAVMDHPKISNLLDSTSRMSSPVVGTITRFPRSTGPTLDAEKTEAPRGDVKADPKSRR